MSPRNPDRRPSQDPNVGGGIFDRKEIVHMMQTILEAEGIFKPDAEAPQPPLKNKLDRKPKQ